MGVEPSVEMAVEHDSSLLLLHGCRHEQCWSSRHLAKMSPDFSKYENSVREGERERQCVFVGAVMHACKYSKIIEHHGL